MLHIPNFGVFTVYLGRLISFLMSLYLLDNFVFYFRKDNR